MSIIIAGRNLSLLGYSINIQREKKIYIKTRKREEQGNELTDVDVAVSSSIFITETGNKNRKKKILPAHLLRLEPDCWNISKQAVGSSINYKTRISTEKKRKVKKERKKTIYAGLAAAAGSIGRRTGGRAINPSCKDRSLLTHTRAESKSIRLYRTSQ